MSSGNLTGKIFCIALYYLINQVIFSDNINHMVNLSVMAKMSKNVSIYNRLGFLFHFYSAFCLLQNSNLNIKNTTGCLPNLEDGFP